MRVFSSLLVVAALFGCSGSTARITPLDEDAGLEDGAVLPGPDGAAGLDAGAARDASADAGDPRDAGESDAQGADCTDPAECSGATPICCASITTGAGTVPNCPLTSASASCRATCRTSLPLACNAHHHVAALHRQSRLRRPGLRRMLHLLPGRPVGHPVRQHLVRALRQRRLQVVATSSAARPR